LRKKLTPAFVAEPPLPEKGDRVIYWDSEQTGLGLVVTTAGHRNYVVQYRNRQGVSRRMSPPPPGALTLTAARTWAKKIIGMVADGRDPLDDDRKAALAASRSLKSICEEYLAREGGKLRTVGDRRATLERLVYPKLGARPIDEIKRSEINTLLDKIEDERGPRMASLTLAYLRKVMNWHETRADDFRSPVVRGMARGIATKRDRVLTDDELRAIWRIADELKTPFARLVQFILLTGARRNEAAHMTRAELNGSDWLIPASRVKGKRDFLVPLSVAAVATTTTLPSIATAASGPVFTHDGKRPLGGFGKLKAAFDMACGVTGWTIHDLRRTARTLMTRAGVDSNHAERCLGHVISGVRGVYDRHEYYDEKTAAFEALAALIDRILNPKANVVPMRAVTQISG
jgi:integrase